MGGGLQGEQERQESAFSEQSRRAHWAAPRSCPFYHESSEPTSHELGRGAGVLSHHVVSGRSPHLSKPFSSSVKCRESVGLTCSAHLDVVRVCEELSTGPGIQV